MTRPNPNRPTLTRPTLILALALLGILAGPAAAQFVYVVNDLRDLEDHDPLDGLCDCDAAMAGNQCSFRAAMQNANWWGGSVEIVLPPMIVPIDHWGTDDICRWGDLDVYDPGLASLVIRGGGAGQTVIDAFPLQALGTPDRILDVRPTAHADVVVELRDLTLSGGAGVLRGGGVRHERGALILTNVDVRSCSANERGGGVWSNSVGSAALLHAVSVTGGSFAANQALQDGGGLALEMSVQPASLFGVVCIGNHAASKGGGLRLRSGSAELAGCTFDGNTASSGAGVNSRGDLEIRDGSFFANIVSGTGGGIAIEQGSLLMERTVLEGNQGQFGGGLAIAGGAAVGADLYDCALRWNTALLNGGGVNNSGRVRLERVTLRGNRAMNGAAGGGGGLHSFGPAVLLNVTMAENEAPTGSGGAIYLLGAHPAEINATTIAWNNAGLAGAGIFVDPVFGAPLLSETSVLLGDNRLFAGLRQSHAGPPPFSAGFNLDEDGTSLLAGPGDQSGTLAAPLFAMISPPAPFGGFSETCELFPGSPAIDAGACVAIDGTSIVEDQRQVARTGLCDVGAFEAGSASACPAPLVQPANQATGIFADADCPQCSPGPAQTVADAVVLATTETIGSVLLTGGYYPNDAPPATDRLTIRVLADAGGIPGALLHEECDVDVTRAATGNVIFGVTEYAFFASFHLPPTLTPGTWWIEVFADSTATADTFFLVSGTLDAVHGVPGIAYDVTVPGAAWQSDPTLDLALELGCGATNTCPADLDHDGQVGFGDLVRVLSSWGPGCSREDLDGDGQIGFGDLVIVLSSWGPCP